ncbi:MAG TPA: AsmA-like C-terminal region-containing protein, partial [Candidatus Omnitrophota bacterium]|nr:AsmA-like C-terminal region-containing protein [Candidatus Omnitrophota bacterium]
HENLPEMFTGVSGNVYYKKDFLRWQNLKGHYKEKPYTFNGELHDFSRPLIDTTAIGEHINLTAQVKVLRSAFQLIAFTGRWFDSSFDLKGDVHLFNNDDADIDLRGKLDLNLENIGSFFPQLKDRMQQAHLLGVLSGQGVFMGKWSDWRNWQLAFDGTSEKIMLKGYPLEKVAFKFTQRDRTISKCNLASMVYGGNLDVLSSVDLRSDHAPFTATISVKNLDFAKYREDKKPKNKRLAGILQGSAELKGSALELKKMTGQGSVNIANGHLWHWSVLSGITKALLIPEFEHSVFTEARGDFTVGDGKISSNNLRMASQYVTLNGKGWIDFDTNLNFDIKPEFSELAILQSDSLKKGPTSIITQTDNYLNIKISGTLAHPHHWVEKSPMKIIEGTIKDTTGTIKEVIGGVVGEIF